MPDNERGNLAVALARKAGEDAAAVRELSVNTNVADAIVGFHAQQAIEKWLKAVLAARGVQFERTHDLDRLIELAEADGLCLPVDVDEVSALTEYAVPFRYDDPLDPEPLDRQRALELVETVGSWADGLVS